MERSNKAYIKELVFAVGLTALTVFVQRAASKPDFARTLGMRVSWGVKRFADGQSRMWSDVAGKAAQKYNGFKP